MKKDRTVPWQYKTTAYERTDEEEALTVQVFNIDQYKLIQEITTRSEKAENFNNIFSFLWKLNSDDSSSNDSKAQ